VQQVPDFPSYENMLAALVTDETNSFYTTLHGIIWRFAASRFGLSGSEMNKKLLVEKMDQAQLPPGLANRLLRILEECEAGMYTGARLLHDRKSMLDDIKEVFGKIRSVK